MVLLPLYFKKLSNFSITNSINLNFKLILFGIIDKKNVSLVNDIRLYPFSQNNQIFGSSKIAFKTVKTFSLITSPTKGNEGLDTLNTLLTY